MNTIIRKFRIALSWLALAALIAGTFALAFPIDSVSAQGSEPPAPPSAEETQARQIERLEKAYQAEQRQLEAQAGRLVASGERAKKLQERIAELKSKGKDTAALETALKDFQDAVTGAQKAHDEAAVVLKKHDGFDASGKVTDIETARQTVKEAGSLLKETRRDLTQALRDLLRAVREHVRDNRKP